MSRESGNAKITKPIYGYTLDRDNNRLVVNPETAPVVKMIFLWYLNGLAPSEICKRLNHMKIMTPRAYYAVNSRGTSAPENDFWNNGKISDILRNQTYIGNKVWGKRKRAFYMQIPEHKVPRSEWVIFENQHEPLVSEETFYTVQEKIHSVSEKHCVKPELYGESKDPLPGKVFCGKCGRKMLFEKYAYCSNRNGGHYYCHGEHLRSECSNDIHSDFLKMTLIAQMQPFVQAVIDHAEIIKGIKTNRSRQTKLLVAENNYQKIKNRLFDTIEKISLLYENFVEGIFDQSEYQDMKEHYQEEKNTLEKMLADAESRRNEAKLEQDNFLSFSQKLESHLGEMSFSSELADLLIKRVNIYPDKKIEIVYCCEDVFQESV